MCIECNHHLVLPLLWHRFAKKVKSFQCTTFWPFGDPSIHKSQYDTNAETNCLWYGPHGQLVRRTHTVWPVFLSSLTTQFHHLERILKMLWEFNINIRFCILQINNIIYIYILYGQSGITAMADCMDGNTLRKILFEWKKDTSVWANHGKTLTHIATYSWSVGIPTYLRVLFLRFSYVHWVKSHMQYLRIPPVMG